MKTNNIEKELNKIRIEIYEETKNLTPLQRIERAKKARQEAVKKYNLKLYSSS